MGRIDTLYTIVSMGYNLQSGECLNNGKPSMTLNNMAAVSA